MTYTLLDQIEFPADLRELKRADLQLLCDELRAYLIESVSKTGGHLSSNLGTVELSVALHYVFLTPEDRIVWDVGHQTYTHKILTGRRGQMPTIRQQGGIAGFTRRAESCYDTFGGGHSSTSISAALGFALAAKIKGEDRRNVAVIGDGAMSGGMAFEALNNAGVSGANLLVVLNDNDMSISPAVGALNRYLARLLSGRLVAGARDIGRTMLSATPSLLRLARRVEEHAKGMITPATLFEEFGFNYIGPINGHDLNSLVPTLENLRRLAGPLFLHVVTQKGYGYTHAEHDPIAYHGPGKFDPNQGLIKNLGKQLKTFTQVFSDWVCDAAKADPLLVAITPAMREGSGLVAFEQQFPERYFDVGIAEQHAVTFAAGLACEGLHVVLAIYSTFLQRGYDQLIHDVAIQNLPMVFAIDRAGVVGADGATHMGAFDIVYLRCIPNMVIMTPADEKECRLMLQTALEAKQPCAVRYPRGSGVGIAVESTLDTLAMGQAEIKHTTKSQQKIALLAFGTMVYNALEVAQQLDLTLANMRFVKPLDETLLADIARQYCAIVSIEEGVIAGGAGSAVLEWLARHGWQGEVMQLGLPDQFIDHGDPQKILHNLGLTAPGIATQIKQRFAHILKLT